MDQPPRLPRASPLAHAVSQNSMSFECVAQLIQTPNQFHVNDIIFLSKVCVYFKLQKIRSLYPVNTITLRACLIVGDCNRYVKSRLKKILKLIFCFGPLKREMHSIRPYSSGFICLGHKQFQSPARSPEITKRRYFPRFRRRNANTNLVDTVPISVD